MSTHPSLQFPQIPMSRPTIHHSPYLTSAQSIVRPVASRLLPTTSSLTAVASVLPGPAQSVSTARTSRPSIGMMDNMSIQPRKTLLKLHCTSFKEVLAQGQTGVNRGGFLDWGGNLRWAKIKYEQRLRDDMKEPRNGAL